MTVTKIHVATRYTGAVGAWVQLWSDADRARARALRSVVTDLVNTRPGATYVLKRISGLGQ
ncbi:hypothetical protein [Amycolatopsis sp.]|uniref:hypothetical protein n=1 Tax=Amycolatopsis sp. TaxID=37632 RepID=UPI002B6CA6D8|nr:hypothetical protein [Amycolatopsis sp.]HVV08521.1 hypothetical protein [Amycolatopsis sp.]